MSDSRFFPIDHPEAKGPDAHIIPASVGLAMRAVQHAGAPEWKSVAFRGEALMDLLTQEGAMGIRLYAGHDGDHATLVAFAVDAQGNDLVGPNAIAVENGERCPPFC
jgi:hypothetical protein